MSIEELIKSCSTYGDIYEFNGNWSYRLDDNKISDAKWARLSADQQCDLWQWLQDGKDEEEWYLKNAKGIWDYIEEQAGLEEEYAIEVIKDIEYEQEIAYEQEYEEACAYDRMIDCEFNKDRI